ncbi:MAG TPA: hypothetical protein PK095_00050 [Myxococcota bacterium]|nr:hypothetical protein [Myxococcota bacterium]
MITPDTAARIWNIHREIKTGEKLLEDMAHELSKPFAEVRDPHAPRLQDAFGRRVHLQLGIPSGDNSHRLFEVSPKLGESVIRAHIERKRAELAEANEQACIELGV